MLHTILIFTLLLFFLLSFVLDGIALVLGVIGVITFLLLISMFYFMWKRI